MDFEFIVCDSPAGIETGALMALYFADEAIITTNPEVSSVRDSTVFWVFWHRNLVAQKMAKNRLKNISC